MALKLPTWKTTILMVMVIISFIYALPNIFGEEPVVQMRAFNTENDLIDSKKIVQVLNNAKITYKSVENQDDGFLIRLTNIAQQIKAQDILKATFSNDFSVALNLAPVTPGWLRALGAKPMKLGLDLRGGVHFLMAVDVASIINKFSTDYYDEVKAYLRSEKLHYKKINQSKNKLYITFLDKNIRNKTVTKLRKHFTDLDFIRTKNDSNFFITINLLPKVIQDIQNKTLEQTMSILRNRVNELGVSEAIVQRHGTNKVIVELPGIQDTAYAKNVLGKTATLEFLMVDHEHDLASMDKNIPKGSKVLQNKRDQSILLKKRAILTGGSITGATSARDQNGQPAVNIRLSNKGIGLFKKTTRNNIGKNMAVSYIETKIVPKIINGKTINKKITTETIISVARINSALGNSFIITGLEMEEARELAMLLRAGALPASVSYVEERIVGPSMGQENIKMGMLSLAVGLGLVLVSMIAYYRILGSLANLALLFNLVLLVAFMSILGATLTLPGIAGIVLTMGMAVDANVLIFERIREELRAGMSSQSSIQRGFEHAFGTIVDANVTTLIVGIILFAIGTGPVKGFAVTLSIGILTSMFTAITSTRALINLFYGNRSIKKLSVGI